MSAPKVPPVALLLSLSPRLRCVAHTDQYGSFSISSKAERPGVPDINTLSIYTWQNSEGDYEDDDICTTTDNTKRKRKEISPADVSCNNACTNSDQSGLNGDPLKGQEFVDQLQRTIGSLPGIQDRLRDAAAGYKSTRGNVVEEFLSRAEAVFAELLEALNQQSKRKQQLEDSGAKFPARDGNNLPLHYYAALSSQLQEILQLASEDSSIQIKSIDDRLRRIVMSCTDRRGRHHDLVAELPVSFPMSAPVVTTDLPINFDSSWIVDTNHHMSFEKITDPIDNDKIKLGQSGGLAKTLFNFCQHADACQGIWDELDELDKHCWVLEPALPARRSLCERRIVLRSGLSIALEIDPQQARGPLLSLRFVGAPSNLADLRNTYNQFVAGDAFGEKDESSSAGGTSHVHWSEAKSVRQNLEECFGPLPSPAESDKSEFMKECGICYSHRLPRTDEEAAKKEGILPDATCGNSACGRSYHETCLFEWLHSLTSARVSFDRIFGTCPYCCESISVRVGTRGSMTG